VCCYGLNVLPTFKLKKKVRLSSPTAVSTVPTEIRLGSIRRRFNSSVPAEVWSAFNNSTSVFTFVLLAHDSDGLYSPYGTRYTQTHLAHCLSIQADALFRDVCRQRWPDVFNSRLQSWSHKAPRILYLPHLLRTLSRLSRTASPVSCGARWAAYTRLLLFSTFA